MSEQSQHRERKGKRPTGDSGIYLDRLPPYSIEAEQGVLGCCLLDPKEALGLAMEQIGGREVFYDMRHQALFATLCEMVNSRRMIDPITLQAFLEEREAKVEGSKVTLLEGLGGMAFIAGLMNMAPSAASLEYYLPIVLERHRLRTMLRVLAESQARIWDWDGEVSALINSIETNVLAAGEDSYASSGIRTQQDVAKETCEIVERCFHRGRGVIDGVATGFSYLDKMLGGLHNGDYGVIGARPSVGKTALMLGIVKHVAQVQKRKVGVFNVEMRNSATFLRMWCEASSVKMSQVRTGFMEEREKARLGETFPKLAKWGIFWDDTPSLEVGTFRARARRMKRLGCELIVLDYLQLMSNPDLEGRERHLEVASISKGIKAATKELNLPIVVMAQLNRDMEKGGSKRKPTLADLGESGQIERDADWVGLIYRPQVKESEQEVEIDEDGNEKEPAIIPVNLLIAKQRNGPTGDCEFLFNREFMRFEDRYAGKGARGGEMEARRHLTTEDPEEFEG